MIARSGWPQSADSVFRGQRRISVGEIVDKIGKSVPVIKLPLLLSFPMWKGFWKKGVVAENIEGEITNDRRCGLSLLVFIAPILLHAPCRPFMATASAKKGKKLQDTAQCIAFRYELKENHVRVLFALQANRIQRFKICG